MTVLMRKDAARPTGRVVRRRFDRRTVIVCSVLAALTVAGGLVAMTLGDYPISVAGVVQVLFGDRTDRLGSYFVTQTRLPRVLATVLVGAALGASGALFQSLSRNPLGSPDLIGFTTGASTGALIGILLVGGSPGTVAGAAVLGGLGTAVLVYLLTVRDGVSGFRLVLVGIGLAAVLQAVNSLLVVRAELGAAQTAAQWLAGSFNDIRWADLAVLAPVLAILLPCALTGRRSLEILALGDDLAAALGQPVQRTRTWLLAVGVLLVAVATAAVGPIAFVALGAPHLARRLCRITGPGIGASALMGGALVLVCDVLAQRLIAPDQLAVGSVTGVLGGGYLIWLLVTTWRRSGRNST